MGIAHRRFSARGLTSRGDRIPVSISQRVHPIFAIQRLEFKDERPFSDVANRCVGALTADIHAVAEVLLFEEGLFVLLVPDVFLHDILFYAFRLLSVFFRQPQGQGLSTSLSAGEHTLRLLARRTRLSTFPEPSCWPNCTEGGPWGSQTCRRDLGFGPCPCTRPRSRSQGEGCQCLRRGAGSSLRDVL